MFPVSFTNKVINNYTKVGNVVLDPFAGRATAVYSAAIQDRVGIGIEINPVGWVYGKAKLFSAKKNDVIKRLEMLDNKSNNYLKASKQLPVFFRFCYSNQVKKFLLAARDQLDWRRCPVDWTIMALLLVYLHGKREASLSNQMRQTKSMSPPYAIRWWKEKKITPPEVDPLEFLIKRIDWRYANGCPKTSGSQVYLGDCNKVLPRLQNSLYRRGLKSVHLLLTSPPYYRVTNYYYDQWLRLWLLGFSPVAYSNHGLYKGRFGNRNEYSQLLLSVFHKASQLLAKDAVVYVRTDAREFTYQTTLQILKEVFPEKRLSIIEQPFRSSTQTHLFGDKSKKVGEIDLILEP